VKKILINLSFIDQIENKLKINDQQLTLEYKMWLKAVQYYFQLLRKGHAKLKANQIVAKLLNHGIWFARCVRSWTKAFKNYGDISKDNRRQVDNILKEAVFLMMKIFN
jgi:hypothetical protein